MNCAEFLAAFRQQPLAGWQCTQDVEFLRILTPLRYSDGGMVEVYAEDRDGVIVLTDFGESFRFLQTYGLDPLRSAIRRQMVDLAVQLGGAVVTEDAIEIVVRERAQLPEALIRLGQVVTRVADLALTAKGTLTATFPDAVEEYLRTTVPGAEIQRNGTVGGRASTHQFDLVVRTVEGTAAVTALSAVSANGASAQAAFTIRKLADIAALGTGGPRRYTVIDDSADVWSESLRGELSNYSSVYDWERRDELAAQLAPARDS